MKQQPMEHQATHTLIDIVAAFDTLGMAVSAALVFDMLEMAVSAGLISIIMIVWRRISKALGMGKLRSGCATTTIIPITTTIHAPLDSSPKHVEHAQYTRCGQRHFAGQGNRTTGMRSPAEATSATWFCYAALRMGMPGNRSAAAPPCSWPQAMRPCMARSPTHAPGRTPCATCMARCLTHAPGRTPCATCMARSPTHAPACTASHVPYAWRAAAHGTTRSARGGVIMHGSMNPRTRSEKLDQAKRTGVKPAWHGRPSG
eukprot:365806-Chlamydomonas_euryale.AAC.12